MAGQCQEHGKGSGCPDPESATTQTIREFALTGSSVPRFFPETSEIREVNPKSSAPRFQGLATSGASHLAFYSALLASVAAS